MKTCLKESIHMTIWTHLFYSMLKKSLIYFKTHINQFAEIATCYTFRVISQLKLKYGVTQIDELVNEPINNFANPVRETM